VLVFRRGIVGEIAALIRGGDKAPHVGGGGH
jgi:hypothetical protein